MCDPAPVAERFLDDYERTFGAILDEELEIVCVRAIATSPLDAGAPTPVTDGAGRDSDGAAGAVRAWSFTAAAELDFAVVDRAQLGIGVELQGPAIIREHTTTTYVDAGHRASVDATRVLLIERAVQP